MSDANRSEDLIAALTADVKPVRRLAPPAQRAALWLALAVAIVAASVLWHGVDRELAAALLEPLHFVEWLAALATGIGGIVAAFHLALPDRSPRWAWVALTPAGVWLGTVGLGCLGEYLAMGMEAFAWGEPWLCLEYITQIGVPMTLLSMVMLRFAGPIRPIQTMLLAGLGMAGLSAAGLAFFHPPHSAWLGLLWHGAAVAVVLASGALGAALLRRFYAPRRG